MIKIELIPDDSCSETFKLFTRIDIEKQDIFNYGVFHYEIPPEKISENDFEYLQSKIPAYYLMYDDYIDIPSNRNAIICKVPGEAAQKVSEIVGIAVGLRAASTIYGIKKKDIKKIGLTKKREKRLDFCANYLTGQIEIETKGTTGKNTVQTMIEDIHMKKEGKDKRISRIGFVTLLRKSDDTDESKIFATDPLSEYEYPQFEGIYLFINYYLIYLSFILDNPQYNKIVRVLLKSIKYRKPIIKTEKIKYVFNFDGKKYYGQCFDKRLLISFINKYIESAETIEILFGLLTNDVGKEKYFLGLDINLINYLNFKDTINLSTYITRDLYKVDGKTEYIQMSDGLLFIKAKDGTLPDMEKQFTEDDVKSRLYQFISYRKNEWHECGASCTSREKLGKPCEIKTFREHCHFHR